MDGVVKDSEDCVEIEPTSNLTTIVVENEEDNSSSSQDGINETNDIAKEDKETDVPNSTTSTASSETVTDSEQSSKLEESEEVKEPEEAISTDFKIPTVPLEKNVSKSATNDSHAEHVTYHEDGTAIYTDPETKYKYIWNETKNSWVPYQNEVDPYENEHYKWCDVQQKWLPKNSQLTETEHYKWDAEKNEWIPKQKTQVKQSQTKAKEEDEGEEGEVEGEREGKRKDSESVTYGVDEDGQRIYTDKDGAIYFWDEKKSAWFPKIDDDFMARYQMNYGFIDNVSASEEEKRKKEAEEVKRKAEELERMAAEARAAMEEDKTIPTGTKRKAPQEPPKWFDMDPAHNTKVYVSNLPLDITLDEFEELMGKCGMIMRDPKTQKYKLKLYAEADGQIKGDGLCDYIKVESVNLAIKLLDESIYRGSKIRVQPAKFQMRGEYNPTLKPKRKKKDKEKLIKMKERLFDWRPEKMRGERTKNEKIVIITNLFTPELFEKEVQLILDYQNDLREECSKCGTVRKVIIYDRHADGVAQINMTSPEEADLVIQMMHGRYFGKRQLSAEHWDGKTKYKVAESEQETKDRLSNWEEYLDEDGHDETNKSTQK